MTTQMNQIELIYRFYKTVTRFQAVARVITSYKKIWFTIVSLALVTLVRAQCPGCDVSVGTRAIQRPAGTICDNNWGWDPWGAARSIPTDPRFTENGGVYPNNDGHIIAGFNFVADCAAECPVYYDKLFFYDPLQNYTRSFKLPAYPRSKIRQITPIEQRYSELAIIFTRTTQYNEPCTSQEMILTPRPEDVASPTRIYVVLYGHENAKDFCGEHYSQLSSFTYTVELPRWKTEADIFKRICQENVNHNLADYFSVPGARFNLNQSHKDTLWAVPNFRRPFTKNFQRANGMYTLDYNYITHLNPQNLPVGVHTLYAMKTYDNGVADATFGSHRGDVQFPFTITVLPAAPTVGNIAVTPSCPGAPDGTISVSGVSGGEGNYRYILRNGENNDRPCDPEKENCFDASAWGDFSGSNLTITGRSPGKYTLWIANRTSGCARTYPVSIAGLSVMDTLPITVQHISCPGGNNGLIHVTDTGGRAPYTFSLISGSINLNNNTGEFNSLTSGVYTMSTEDGCGHRVQRIIELTEPSPVTMTVTASATDCHNPANGAIDVNASGGSGTFDYYLYDNNGNTVSQQLGSTATNWRIPALGAGKYTVSVTNTLAPGCTPTTQPVDIDGPLPIAIDSIGQTNNTCSYDAMGTLTLSATGGQENGYIFFLQNTATGQTQQSTTGSFSGLPAAEYKAWVRNADLSCLDSAIYAAPINILAPPVLTAVASGTDITCNGNGDGTLQAVTAGGTPAYNLQWQQWDEQAANWLPMSSRTGVAESNLLQGRYRLLVSDQNSCSAYSNTVDIAEPNTLSITAVNRTDIVCYGGTGSIQMTVSGGNGNYIFEHSTDNGNSWNAFTAATALPAASYQLKVSDSKGCVTAYNQPVQITAPATPLAITYTLTNYNGFNVPCYGSHNGVVQLTATGGNGSTYTGYTFAVDNGAFSAANPVSTNAGNHTFSVSDARGCVVTTTATLTEPAAQMQSIISNKQDNDCAGGQTGMATVTTTGGTPRYTFSINGGNYQSFPVFSGLTSGNYQIVARDVNGCLSNAGVTIVDLNPPITHQATISDVLCYNGSDGRITLSPAGGVPSYSYAWKNSAATGNVLSGVPAGNYSVTITDSKGCTLAENFTVAQPLNPLSATTHTRPVCINNPFGNISIYAQGGTSPYMYSVNGGAGYGSNGQFNNMPAGSYPVKVADANGCTWDGTATIPVNGINPTLNFLVSTRQNALDTLQVKEICTPKPDSIHWTFDPQTMVIDNNMYNPLIRFNREGNYVLTMKAWFAGCDFTTTKVITINPYDPGVVNNYNNLYGIDTVMVAPNPNNGNFNLKVKLYKNQRLLIKVYSVAGTVLWSKQWEYIKEVQEAITLPSNIGNGLVFVKVLTDDDVQDVDVLIAK